MVLKLVKNAEAYTIKRTVFLLANKMRRSEPGTYVKAHCRQGIGSSVSCELANTKDTCATNVTSPLRACDVNRHRNVGVCSSLTRVVIRITNVTKVGGPFSGFSLFVPGSKTSRLRTG